MKLNLSAIERFVSRIANLSIAKKIGYGYALSVGVAVAGTSVGLIFDNYYQERARENYEIADRQQQLLEKLNSLVLSVRLHPQELLVVLEDSIGLQFEKSQFRQTVVRAREVLVELAEFLEKNPNTTAIDVAEFKTSLAAYRETIDANDRLIQKLWRRIDAIELRADTVAIAEKQIVDAIRGEEMRLEVQFEKLSKNLEPIRQRAQQQEEKANEQLERANVLRLQTILIGMALSTTLAVVLGSIASRAIVRPIQSVTQVARQVVSEEDFSLQVPVPGEDEVGVLARSFNQLIQWVCEHTEELEVARESLELRVKERTQELSEALAELQQTQVQLIQTEKMSSLGQLVAGIAHEINNPVGFIYGNLSLLRESSHGLLKLLAAYQKQYSTLAPEIERIVKEEDIDIEYLLEDYPHMLESMEKGTDRIRAIVLSLRNFSRLDETGKKEADLHEGIDNTLLILNNKLKKEIDAIRNYGNLPLVRCYPAQLNQVFMNLIANAAEALLETDTTPKQIVIETSTIGDRARIVVRDNGPGIPPQIRSKIFDPFFTTKPVGSGTGLGLSIGYKIVVEKHRGTIACNSIPGQGTEFIVEVPIYG